MDDLTALQPHLSTGSLGVPWTPGPTQPVWLGSTQALVGVSPRALSASAHTTPHVLGLPWSLGLSSDSRREMETARALPVGPLPPDRPEACALGSQARRWRRRELPRVAPSLWLSGRGPSPPSVFELDRVRRRWREAAVILGSQVDPPWSVTSVSPCPVPQAAARP